MSVIFLDRPSQLTAVFWPVQEQIAQHVCRAYANERRNIVFGSQVVCDVAADSLTWVRNTAVIGMNAQRLQCTNQLFTSEGCVQETVIDRWLLLLSLEEIQEFSEHLENLSNCMRRTNHGLIH